MDWQDDQQNGFGDQNPHLGRPGGDWRGLRPRFDNPMSWALDLFSFKNIQVRVHIFFLIFIAIQLIRATWASEDDSTSISPANMAVVMAALFGVVLLHEFGHCMACRLANGDATEILMWPLGGLASCMPDDTPSSHLITTAGGPLVNVVICMVLGPILYIGTGQFMEVAIPHPVYILNGLNYTSVAESWLWIGVYSVHAVSFVLLLFNLLPMYPLDGGRLVQAMMWPRLGYANSMRLSVRVGFVGAILLGIFGFVTGEIMLVAIAFFGGLTCYTTGRQLEYTEMLMNYEGGEVDSYTKSLSWSPDKDDDDQPERMTRAEKKAVRVEEKGMEEAQEVDAILEKISQTGMDSLSRAERKLLERATQRKQKEEEPDVS